MTLKLNQLLRKLTQRHLYVSAINTVRLKEIEPLVFKWQTVKVKDFKFFNSIDICVKLSNLEYIA